MSDRPNILIIIADQLAQRAVGAYGNDDVSTPHIDSIAARGARFSNSYTPYPLCVPARASFWTSRYPHETGVQANGLKGKKFQIPGDMPTLGEAFRNAGYTTIHFGKQHDAGSLRGFDVVEVGRRPVEDTPAWPVNHDTTRDRDTTIKCVDYLETRTEAPFLMVADLINPHNICGWVGENEGPHEDEPIDRPLPALLDNFETEDLADRPVPIQYICCNHRRLKQAAHWNETNYRHYLAAYYHYTQRVDKEIGLILDALKKTPGGENTLVVFMADHGDGMGAHRMTTKLVSFYEEMTRIPLMFAGPGVKGGGRLVEAPLASTLDLFPTLCDYAGIDAPAGLRGRSLMPWLTGGKAEGPEYVVSQWYSAAGGIITPGRMLRTQRYKYTRYLEDGGEELFDLENDPGETRTLVKDPAHADALDAHRKLFDRYVAAAQDPFFEQIVEADPRWRSHPIGYQNHEGPCVLDV